jgi:hypothetical protein
MIIERVKSHETWYKAMFHFKTKKGTIATASGYGTTHANAMTLCIADYKLIMSL